MPYVALLTRLNFDAEGGSRMAFRQSHPPTRIWKSARRFPMMHRHGYAGKKSTSNVGYWWLVGSVMRRGSSRKITTGKNCSPHRCDWRCRHAGPPTDLADRIKQTLAERSALSWDQATSAILDEIPGSRLFS